MRLRLCTDRLARAVACGLPLRILNGAISAALLFFASAFAFAMVALTPRAARAEPPSMRATPVHVLGIDSEDAENQADALTGAIRSRVRTAPGWSLQETQHSLAMLTAALRCPPKPDAACLLRIGDQLHTDRFVWGVMSKAPGGQVNGDIHLWSRGKPDTSVKETYSDNLKDQNDETLRKVAARIFDRLTGATLVGTVTVHAGDADGMVWVDGGQKKQLLDHGTATLELAVGSHAVEVRATGFAVARMDATVTGGQDTPLAFKLVPDAPRDVGEKTSSKPTPVRRIVAWSAIGVGALALGIGGFEGLRFLSLKGDLDDDRSKLDKSVVDVCAADPITQPAAADACSKFQDAKSARTMGVLLGSAGAVAVAAGVVLLLTEHPTESGSPEPTAARAQPQGLRLVGITPFASPRGEAGVHVALTF